MSKSSKGADTKDTDQPKPGSDSQPKEASSNSDVQKDGFPVRGESEPTIADEQREEPVRPTKSSPTPPKDKPDEDTTKKARQEPTQDEANQEQLNITSSLRRMVNFAMTSFFDWNPSYFLQMRGILNVLHVIMGVIVVVILGVNCQLHTFPTGSSEGFFCQPPETFLFVSSVASFLTSITYLFCCLLSKKTERLLNETSFEVCYYILYFVLLLTSSAALLISAVSWGSERMMYGNDYDLTHAAAVIGLLNSIAYGISAATFFISQRYRSYSTHTLPKV